VYAQCTQGRPGGVTLLALNLSRTSTATMDVPQRALRYTLAADDLMRHVVALNGSPLQVSGEGHVPELKGLAQAKGQVTLPKASITFFTFADAGNPACR
jgi:hypothetical protein